MNSWRRKRQRLANLVCALLQDDWASPSSGTPSLTIFAPEILLVFANNCRIWPFERDVRLFESLTSVSSTIWKMANQIGWIRWLPGLVTLRQYQITWLPHDIVAGTVLATMLVPVGIAYAVASGVPGICGLYATIVPLLAYALFGPSRILVLGPDSSLAAVILGVVFPLSAGDSARAEALAGMMAVVSGVVCILVGVARRRCAALLQTTPRNSAPWDDQSTSEFSVLVPQAVEDAFQAGRQCDEAVFANTSAPVSLLVPLQVNAAKFRWSFRSAAAAAAEQAVRVAAPIQRARTQTDLHRPARRLLADVDISF
jgi:Sulfate permease family